MVERAFSNQNPLDASRLLGITDIVLFSAAKCDRWKSGCGDCPQLKAYPKTYGADHTQRNYRQKQACFTGLANLTIIVPSEWLAGQ